MSSFARRLFKSSKSSVNNDLAVLEESHDSTFAPVPSALSPSRAPCNTFITGSRALFLKVPVRFDFPYGWEKGPVIDCIERVTSTLTTTNPDTPFDTLMKAGCTAYDTIEEVAWEELDSCVVKLHWRGDQTIDLLFVLSICFGIHSDNQAKWYTLQHYNCYFLSWAIIVITMRKCAVFADRLNAAMKCFGLTWTRTHPLGLDLAWELGLVGNEPWHMAMNVQKVGAERWRQKLGLVHAQEHTRQPERTEWLRLEISRELALLLEQEQEWQEREWEKVWELMQEEELDIELVAKWKARREPELLWERERVLELARAQAVYREVWLPQVLDRVLELELELEPIQVVAHEWEGQMEKAREWEVELWLGLGLSLWAYEMSRMVLMPMREVRNEVQVRMLNVAHVLAQIPLRL
ncbi:hypothetical protein PILCRDRAFT_12877 [Piloderma croceum F 1598]|uniref:Uncharacterized protein n=1 Tax=Piloderma croceum (strain F 1598) TaxID=765440 RepID=A0A0C3F991_PILCF|nr:hypothetical protein PILCRDRAFT_12877 [Piloderma croceum F 1598]